MSRWLLSLGGLQKSRSHHCGHEGWRMASRTPPSKNSRLLLVHLLIGSWWAWMVVHTCNPKFKIHLSCVASPTLKKENKRTSDISSEWSGDSRLSFSWFEDEHRKTPFSTLNKGLPECFSLSLPKSDLKFNILGHSCYLVQDPVLPCSVFINRETLGLTWWNRTVILPNQETEAGASQVQGQTEKLSKILSQIKKNNTKEKKERGAWGAGSML